MGKQTATLSEEHIAFIGRQKMFFVATATETSRINLSPKGMDSFAVLSNSRVAWLNLTGSGNETAAHVQLCPRMTIMFCAFEGNPQVMRLYGQAKVIHQADAEWPDMLARFPALPGARQIFDLTIDLVQTSCGFGVPYFDYAGEREMLTDWAQKKDRSGLRAYWEKKNQTSIDGLPTHILQKSG